MAKKPRLGRGLSSLMAAPVPVNPPAGVEATPEAASPGGIGDVDRDEPSGGVAYVAVERIKPNPHQPRQHFDKAALEQLGRSIQQDGLMQPIVLRRSPGGDGYELVAGERRWRAATAAGIAQLPAIVRDLDDRQLAEWALIENLQREDLDPIEKARAFQGLVDQFALSHDQIADRVGIERPTVSNYLRLLELPDEVLAMVGRGPLTMGHARALLSIPDAQAQQLLASQAVKEGWSVRQIEREVRGLLSEDQGEKSTGGASGGASRPARSPHLADLEQQVANQLQTKVRIKPGRKKGSGTMTIEFYSLDQFDQLLEQLGVKID